MQSRRRAFIPKLSPLSAAHTIAGIACWSILGSNDSRVSQPDRCVSALRMIRIGPNQRGSVEEPTTQPANEMIRHSSLMIALYISYAISVHGDEFISQLYLIEKTIVWVNAVQSDNK